MNDLPPDDDERSPDGDEHASVNGAGPRDEGVRRSRTLFSGFVPVLVTERRRRLADLLAGTVVVREEAPTAQ